MNNWRPGVTLADVEREIITQALRSLGGDKARVARELGVSERTIRKRVQRYELGEFVKPPGRPKRST